MFNGQPDAHSPAPGIQRRRTAMQMFIICLLAQPNSVQKLKVATSTQDKSILSAMNISLGSIPVWNVIPPISSKS